VVERASAAMTADEIVEERDVLKSQLRIETPDHEQGLTTHLPRVRGSKNPFTGRQRTLVTTTSALSRHLERCADEMWSATPPRTIEVRLNQGTWFRQTNKRAEGGVLALS
jgi:hypothetical protein